MAGHGTNQWKKLGDGSTPSEDPGIGLGHIVSIRTYNYVFVSLICLTLITVWVATHDLGALNVIIAMLIATVKATVVALLFMHLNYENKLIWMIVVYPVFILGLMLLGTVGDASVKEKVVPIRAQIASSASPVSSGH